MASRHGSSAPFTLERDHLRETRPRRVRHEVRDGLAVAATSIVASIGFVLVLTFAMRLAG
jgi:hypothetical protein